MYCKLIVLSGLLALTQAGPLSSFGVGSRIAGGEDAKKGEFPYLVSLAWDMPPVAKLDHICGGAILNEKWILTTANCLYFIPVSVGTLRVKAGQHRFGVQEPEEQVAIVRRRILHKNFDLRTAANNIALLNLKEPLKLNENVAAIKLPQANSAVPDEVTVAGWGITSVTGDLTYPKVLQKLNSSLYNIQDCKKAYDANTQNLTLVSLENNFCTASPPGQSVCFGDGGVPLISNEPGKPREVVGLVTWIIHPCTILDLPQVHVKVSSYVNWIQSIILGV